MIQSFSTEFCDNNIIEANFRRGIRMQGGQLTTAIPFGIIHDNKFYDDPKTFFDPAAIFQHVGVGITQTQRIRIEDNDFFQNYQSSIDHEYKGIWLSSAHQSLVIGNRFFGNFGPAPFSSFFKYRGLDNGSSNNCFVSCNESQNLDAGFAFFGPGCNPVNFKANVMRGNIDDLYLQAGTIIGEQLNKENKWPDSSPTEARFDGNPNQGALSMSRFLINSINQNTVLWANPRVPGNGWFSFSGGSPTLDLPCYKDEQDPTNPPQPRAGVMVINGTFEPYKGYPASTWEASLGAFSVLIAHPELRPVGSLDAQFYNLHNTGNVGKLQRAREAWESIALFSTSLESSWNNNQTAVSQKLDEIGVQTQQMVQAQTPTQQGLIVQTLTALRNELNALQQANQSLSTQYLSEVSSRANLLLSDLAAISSIDIWESNLKTVLLLLVQRQLTGISEWSESQKNTLQSIADQCRHEGGIGVVMARTVIEKFDYDDEAMCPGFIQERNLNANDSFNTTLVPNPADDICHIVFDKVLSGMLTLFDPQGREQYCIQLTDAASYDLNTRGLPVGLYYVQVKTGQGVKCSSKLAIVH